MFNCINVSMNVKKIKCPQLTTAVKFSSFKFFLKPFLLLFPLASRRCRIFVWPRVSFPLPALAVFPGLTRSYFRFGNATTDLTCFPGIALFLQFDWSLRFRFINVIDASFLIVHFCRFASFAHFHTAI